MESEWGCRSRPGEGDGETGVDESGKGGGVGGAEVGAEEGGEGVARRDEFGKERRGGEGVGLNLGDQGVDEGGGEGGLDFFVWIWVAGLGEDICGALSIWLLGSRDMFGEPMLARTIQTYDMILEWE